MPPSVPAPLVLGGQGFLGSNVVSSLRRSTRVIAHSRNTKIVGANIESALFDFTDVSAFERALDSHAISYVVNCVALADVDRCEQEPDSAMTINAYVPGRLAEVCRDRGIPFVHVSTDAVFDGMSDENAVDSKPNPVNVYGHSKLAGEHMVLASNEQALVLRTNIIGWSPSGQRSLFEFFVNNLRARSSCNGFVDITFRPISAWHFSPIVTLLLAEEAFGLHHIVGAELLSKFEFGQVVAEVLGVDPALVKPTNSDQIGGRVRRSPTLNLVPSPRLESLAMPIKEQLAQLLDLEKSGLRAELSSFISQG